MYGSTERTDVVKREHFWLRVDRRLIGLLRWVDCDILAQDFNRIDRIFISLKYIFFSESLTVKNSEVKRVWPEAISRWVTDGKSSLVRTSKYKKCAEKTSDGL
jgi:hypothetical protein